MADWDDVRRLATGLPGVTEITQGRSGAANQKWVIKDKLVAWERPLRKADLAALGEAAPQAPILAAWVPDRGAKESLVADSSGAYFTTPHFDGWDIVLVVLDRIPLDELEELIIESWLRQAPRKLASQYLKDLGQTTEPAED
jgi:hypothetical protein